MKWLSTLLLVLGLFTPLLAQNITQVEYFFDTDRGNGQNPRLNITTPGTDVTRNLTIPLTGVTPGFHLLYLRARDAQGVSSITHQRLIYVVPPAVNKNVTQLEYYFDTDRGHRLNPRLNLTPGLDVTQALTIPMTGLTPGFHLLYLRARNAQGAYSITQQRLIYVVPPAVNKNVTQLEYYFDTDRGHGQNPRLNLTPGLDVTQAVTIPLTGVTPGFHLLYLRARNAQGVFGITQQRLVYVVPPTVNKNITQLEYYFDTDRGHGQNPRLNLTPGTDVTQVVTIPLTNITPGYHLLYLRARNAQGVFSITQQRLVYVQRNQTLANITKLEYYYVRGTTTTATATYVLPVPSPNPAIIIPASVSGLTSGLQYTIYIWATNARGTRSLVYSKQFTYRQTMLADMTVKRGTLVVPDGGTNSLGSVTLGTISAATAFTIGSVGNATLTLTGNPRVTITGANATEFALVQPTVASLAPATSTTFTVAFRPTATGPRTARLQIASNSPYEKPYVINLTGNSICPVIGAPTALTAASASSTQINLAWTDNATNETAYLVERATAAAGPFVQVASLAANVKTFANTGLLTNTPYFYRVRASGVAPCTSGYSNVANATPSGTPVAPTALTSTAVSISQINLAWTDNATNETAYLVERATAAAGPFIQIASLAANVNTYASTGLTDATAYFYRVRASNAVGNSLYSNVVSATTPCILPTAPTGLSSAATSSSQVTLNWIDEANNETGYLVERATAAAGPFTQIAILPANTEVFVNNGLVALTQYFYRVRASRVCGNSGYSNVTSATTTASLASLRINCGGPAFTTGSGRAFTADASFVGNTVTSTVATDILGTTDDALYQTQRRSNASPSNFAYNLAAAAGNYTLRLYFAETQFTAVGQRVFSVSVEGVPVLTNYDIVADADVRTAAIKIFNVRSDGIVNIYFTNVTGFATVSAIELIPVGASRLLSAETEWSQASESELRVQPNPFSNKVTLSFRIPETSYTTLEVYDVRGALVERLFAQEATADQHYSVEVSGMLWQSGMYVGRLTTKDRVQHCKMILQK